MSETANENKDAVTGDPEGEWDTVVRRISDRIKKKPGGASSTQSSLDLAGELVRLERRALEAEGALASERDAYAVRVREMEDKLRKLEPWLRQLKGEYQKAAAERDKLREDLRQAVDSAPSQSAADSAKVSVLESEREAALREAEAARAARDVALAEAETLKKRIESEKTNVQSSAHERIAAAEKARDQALEDLKQMRKAAGESRRTEDEVKRLLKQIEGLETTTSAHKAVARAAQEEVEALKGKIGDLEKASQKKAESVREEGRRSQELAKQLEQAKAELAAAQGKIVEAENAAAAARAETDKICGEAGALTRALAASREETEQAKKTIAAARDEVEHQKRATAVTRDEADQSKKTVEKMRAEVADAKRQAEHARAEVSQTKTELAQAKRDADAAGEELKRTKAAFESAKAAGQKAREDGAAAQRDAGEAKELAEEAMRAEEQARRRCDELAEKLASAEQAVGSMSLRVRELDAWSQDMNERFAAESHGREDAERRAKELDQRAEQAETRGHELSSELELVHGRVRALENETANLSRVLDEERESAVKRFDAAETSWKSQMHAAEARFEADAHREREKTREAEESLRVAKERHERAVAEHAAELVRVRGAAMQFLATKTQELAAGMQRIVGGELIDVQPLFAAAFDGERTASPETLAGGAPEGQPADWDRLISDVEQLWTEVEGMREGGPAREETASMSAEEAAIEQAKAAAAQLVSPDDLAFDEPSDSSRPVSDGQTVEMDETHTAPLGEQGAGRRKKRRR